MTTWARVVHEVPADRIVDPLPSGRWPLQLHDILALAANLADAGYKPGGTIEKIDAITEALDRRLAPDIGRYLTDLLELDPAEVAERCRQAGIDLAASEEMATARRAFDERLATDAAASLRANSDQIVHAMRTEFDPAIEIVRVAVDAGLTTATDVRSLADTADGGTLDAYRQLAPAVATLDRVSQLRTAMATVAGIGPSDYVMANYLAKAGSIADLDGAQATWEGEIETVAVELPSGGHHSARTRRPRLGGPWLALLGAGYELRLNSGREANAVVSAARRATVG